MKQFALSYRLQTGGSDGLCWSCQRFVDTSLCEQFFKQKGAEDIIEMRLCKECVLKALAVFDKKHEKDGREYVDILLDNAKLRTELAEAVGLLRECDDAMASRVSCKCSLRPAESFTDHTDYLCDRRVKLAAFPKRHEGKR